MHKLSVEGQHRALLSGIDLAFIGLGFPNGLLGIVWPNMRRDLGLPLQAGGVLSMVLLCSSAAVCLFLPYFLKRYRATMLALWGSVAAGASLLVCCLGSSYLWLVALCVPLGMGQGMLDLSLNHYVAEKYFSRNVNWLQTCWCVGAGGGVLLATQALERSGSWRSCYMLLGILQLIVTAVFLIAVLLWGREDLPPIAGASKSDFSILKNFSAWTCVLIVFLYSGAECNVSMWANSLLIERWGQTVTSASACMFAFFAALLAGRFLSGAFVNRLGDEKMIAGGIAVSFAASILLYIKAVPAFGPIGIALFGLGLAPIMPCMVHLTAQRFGAERAADVQGIQFCISYLGGSVLSAALGVLYSGKSLEAFGPAMLVLLLGMVFLFRQLAEKKLAAK